MTAVSGESASTPPASKVEPGTLPDGFIAVKQSDHDAVQGDLRRTRKELAGLKAQQEERDRKERQDAAAAAGEFDKVVGEERSARAKAERRAQKAALGDAITDVLLSRNYTGEQAVAIKRLVDRDSVDFDADGDPVPSSVAVAVDSVVQQFPNLFNPVKPQDDPPPRVPRKPGPATPPPESQGGKPDGYVSPEEYSRTPMAVRYSAAFKERVALSEPFWPKHINRSDLQQDAS